MYGVWYVLRGWDLCCCVCCFDVLVSTFGAVCVCVAALLCVPVQSVCWMHLQ